MLKATQKWLAIKISSVLLIPLMIWFILNLVSIYDANNSQIIDFLSGLSNKIIFSLFLILAFTFFTLTISEVFEDYINDIKIKNAANKALNFFAIVIPVITIIVIFNLSA